MKKKYTISNAARFITQENGLTQTERSNLLLNAESYVDLNVYFICFRIATTTIYYDNQTPILTSIMHCRRVRSFHSQATLMRNENSVNQRVDTKYIWDDEWCYTVCEQGSGRASAEGKQGEARWSGLALSRYFVECYFYPGSWITIIYSTLHIQGSCTYIHMSKQGENHY